MRIHDRRNGQMPDKLFVPKQCRPLDDGGGFLVKFKGGEWSNAAPLARSSWYTIQAKCKWNGIYKGTFGCNVNRRWRFDVHAPGGCNKNIYYPSATGWTKSTGINFGDISRHCK